MRGRWLAAAVSSYSFGRSISSNSPIYGSIHIINRTPFFIFSVTSPSFPLRLLFLSSP